MNAADIGSTGAGHAGGSCEFRNQAGGWFAQRDQLVGEVTRRINRGEKWRSGVGDPAPISIPLRMPTLFLERREYADLHAELVGRAGLTAPPVSAQPLQVFGMPSLGLLPRRLASSTARAFKCTSARSGVLTLLVPSSSRT